MCTSVPKYFNSCMDCTSKQSICWCEQFSFLVDVSTDCRCVFMLDDTHVIPGCHRTARMRIGAAGDCVRPGQSGCAAALQVTVSDPDILTRAALGFQLRRRTLEQ